MKNLLAIFLPIGSILAPASFSRGCNNFPQFLTSAVDVGAGGLVFLFLPFFFAWIFFRPTKIQPSRKPIPFFLFLTWEVVAGNKYLSKNMPW